jgi:hypothetical protein
MLGANVRFYAAPGYHQLPGRLRPSETAGMPAEEQGEMTIGRVKHNGDWDANPRVWELLAPAIRHHTGVKIVETRGVDLAKDDLSQFQMLHLTGRTAFNLTKEEKDALKKYLAEGGFLLMDADCGRDAFMHSATELIAEIAPGRAKRVSRFHPLLRGQFPGGKKIETADVTVWARRKMVRPTLQLVEMNEKPTILYAPLDLTAAMNGHYVYGSIGFTTETAKQVIMNIVGWRFSQLPKPEPVEVPGEAAPGEAQPGEAARPAAPEVDNSAELLQQTRAKWPEWVKAGHVAATDLRKLERILSTPPEKRLPEERSAVDNLKRALKSPVPATQLIVLKAKLDGLD